MFNVEECRLLILLLIRLHWRYFAVLAGLLVQKVFLIVVHDIQQFGRLGQFQIVDLLLEQPVLGLQFDEAIVRLLPQALNVLLNLLSIEKERRSISDLRNSNFDLIQSDWRLKGLITPQIYSSISNREDLCFVSSR